jgi:hypothetical protein
LLIPATAAEAIDAAGLNFDVELVPLFTTAGLSLPQRKAVIRGDSQQVLGVVGSGNYKCGHRGAKLDRTG